MSDQPSRNPLPFEPSQKRKKKSKPQAKPVASKAEAKPKAKPDKPRTSSSESMAIPDQVSKRMVRRMALLCGIPTALGILSFVVSYLVVVNLEIKLPNVAVVLVSMGFFGLGVLGLSYGVLSASWEEEIPGTLLGWQEFTTNLGRLTSAWREAREAKKS
ncbi:photosystem II biosynthesis protein [Coleofasciculus sp. G2-EDA-02]|uniref:photosystem II biosynthesis protein n=1 Tax=Coleofasciculus sp. G2-EDA-02 TaxID=3069529 RepID=UPI0032F3EC21